MTLTKSNHRLTLGFLVIATALTLQLRTVHAVEGNTTTTTAETTPVAPTITTNRTPVAKTTTTSAAAIAATTSATASPTPDVGPTTRDSLLVTSTPHLPHEVSSNKSPTSNLSYNGPLSCQSGRASDTPSLRTDDGSSAATKIHTDQSLGPSGSFMTESLSGDYSAMEPGTWDENGTLPDWQFYPMEWPWYLILQVISGVIGIVGNLLVMLVLFERRAACRSTDTLIGGLAVADFLTSFFIIPLPEEKRLPVSWVGEIYCKLVNTQFFMWVSIVASTYILMAISIERYIAIAHPLYFNRLLTRRRIAVVIALIWLLAFLSALFGFFVEMVGPESRTCIFKLPSTESQFIIAYYWFFLRMVIPMLTMLITQTLIARELHHQSLRFKNDKDSSTSKTVHMVARTRVLKMMFEVIIIYIVCWAPNQIAYLGYVLGFVPPSYLGSPLHHTLTVLGFYNSCANPFIYTARHPQFREALKGMFTGVKGGHAPLFEQKFDSTAFRSYGRTDVEEGNTA